MKEKRKSSFYERCEGIKATNTVWIKNKIDEWSPYKENIRNKNSYLIKALQAFLKSHVLNYSKMMKRRTIYRNQHKRLLLLKLPLPQIGLRQYISILQIWCTDKGPKKCSKIIMEGCCAVSAAKRASGNTHPSKCPTSIYSRVTPYYTNLNQCNQLEMLAVRALNLLLRENTVAKTRSLSPNHYNQRNSIQQKSN